MFERGNVFYFGSRVGQYKLSMHHNCLVSGEFLPPVRHVCVLPVVVRLSPFTLYSIQLAQQSHELQDVVVPEIALVALKGSACSQVQIQDLVPQLGDGEPGPHVLASFWLGAGGPHARIAAVDEIGPELHHLHREHLFFCGHVW